MAHSASPQTWSSFTSHLHPLIHLKFTNEQFIYYWFSWFIVVLFCEMFSQSKFIISMEEISGTRGWNNNTYPIRLPLFTKCRNSNRVPSKWDLFFFFFFFQKKFLRDTKQTWAITLEQQFFDTFFPQHLDGFHYLRRVASRILHGGMACLYQSPVLFINFFLEICIVVSEHFGREWMNTLAHFCWDPMLAELL